MNSKAQQAVDSKAEHVVQAVDSTAVPVVQAVDVTAVLKPNSFKLRKMSQPMQSGISHPCNLGLHILCKAGSTHASRTLAATSCMQMQSYSNACVTLEATYKSWGVRTLYTLYCDSMASNRL